jgi:MscS family membrane protein
MFSWFNTSLAPYLQNKLPDIKILGIALAIFLFFLFLRKFLAKKISQLLLKISKRTSTCLDDQLVKAFEVPLQIFFTILGLYLALAYLPLRPQQDLAVLKLFRSSIIILLAFGFYRFVGNDLFCREIENRFNLHLDKILVPFLATACKVIIVLLGIAIIASEWGFDINGFIAGLGIGGLAIALAAQNTLANLFGGVVIISDKPFSIGDWIQTPSVEGLVEDINFRSTRVRTFAQALVTVPNSTLANEAIINWSRMGKRRVSFNLPVTHFTSKAGLQKCLEEIRALLTNHPDVSQETIFVAFDSFGTNGFEIMIYYFTKTTVWGEYLQVKEDVNFKIMSILEKADVSIALPSTSVYFEPQLEEIALKETEKE